MLPWPDVAGYAAAFLTTASFLPQAILTLRTRDVSGISLTMYTCFTIGVSLWLIYGVSKGDWPVILANALTLVQASAILAMKIGVERKNRLERMRSDRRSLVTSTVTAN